MQAIKRVTSYIREEIKMEIQNQLKIGQEYTIKIDDDYNLEDYVTVSVLTHKNVIEDPEAVSIRYGDFLIVIRTGTVSYGPVNFSLCSHGDYYLL